MSPYHPASFLAELVVGSVAFYFLALTITNASIPVITSRMQNLSPALGTVLWLVLVVLYFGFLNLCFIKWDWLVYRGVIVRLSNLYKPIDRSTA